MILGYLIFLGSGALIKHSFKIERELKDVSLVTNGLAALITFFKEAVNSEIERVLSKDYQLAIARYDDVFVAIFSDIDDAMALGLARKYVRIIGNKLRDMGIGFNMTKLDRISTAIKDVIEKLEKEIEILNQKASEVKYI